MKRLLPLVLVLCLALSACGSKEIKAYDPSGATQALLDAGAFSLTLEELDVNLLYGFDDYGLDADQLTDSKAYAASGFAEQVSVTVWKTGDGAKKAVEALGLYLQDMKDMNANYAPTEVAKLNNAIVKQNGNSVLLVVPADAEAAKAAVERLG